MMKKMLEEETDPNSGIMKLPIIEEEELVEVIRNMKNGKASGIDDRNSERMTFLIKDDQTRK